MKTLLTILQIGALFALIVFLSRYPVAAYTMIGFSLIITICLMAYRQRIGLTLTQAELYSGITIVTQLILFYAVINIKSNTILYVFIPLGLLNISTCLAITTKINNR